MNEGGMMNIDEKEIEIDKAFGSWLRAQREREKFTVIQAESISGINRFRIKQLESGTLLRGATKPECQALARLYRVCPAEVLGRAAGTWVGEPEAPVPA